MNKLELLLKSIDLLLKGIGQITSPKPPAIPTAPKQPINPSIKQPTLAPVSNKNPVKVAEQMPEPKARKIAIKQAKNLVKFDSNGQWSLED